MIFFFPNTPTTNIFQADRLHSYKLLNGVYNKCIPMNWENERKGENPLTNSEVLSV